MFTIKKLLPRSIRGQIMRSLSFLPDKLYLQLFYFATCKKIINFKNPRGYNEKLQWMKIYDRHPEYTCLAGKIQVRKIVKEKLGADCIIPLLGIWNSFDEIDFSLLPDAFVLKCSHDSGSVKIINNKENLTEFEKEDLKKFYTKRLKRDFYFAGREYSYKGLIPRIIAEPLMGTEEERKIGIKDYKLYCFDGEPKLILIISGRHAERHEDFFDADFNWLPEIRNGYKSSDRCPSKPQCIEKIIEYAKILSAGIRHVRMDFYEIDGKVYFGEYTFFSGGGFEIFEPYEWEIKIGDWIKLNNSDSIH